MATIIKPKLSTKNPYYISKHRYYELKHFCLQYPEWQKEYDRLEAEGIPSNSIDICNSGEPFDPTSRLAMEKSVLLDKMDLVNYCADMTDRDIGPYIRVAVIEGYSYDKLAARLYVPCGRTEYYELYRRFFYILDKKRR